MRGDDAFGRSLWDKLHGFAVPAVLEREDGFIDADVYGDSLYFSPYAKWPALEKRLLRLARGRVLDIGCGAGRHSLYLQEKGMPVTAIDESPMAVAVTKARGVKRARVLPAAQVDRLAPARFDTVLMLGHNLGLLGSIAGARAFFRRLEQVTAPEARLLGTSVDPYQTSNRDHLAYHRLNRKRGRMSGQLRLRTRYGMLATGWFDWLFLSVPEFEEMLAPTTWRVARHVPSGGPVYGLVIERR